jgi:hypothetical protein
LADAWLDAASYNSWWVHDVPIAIAAGVDQGDAENRVENETTDWLNLAVLRTNWLACKYRE